jgi:type II secretory pathway predicted ATPase ExeA
MDTVKFFGLEREAFQNDLDPRFYFEGSSQRRARMQILRAVQQRKGLVLVLGRPGLGKTTLAHHLLADLDRDKFAAQLLVSSHRECARGWFLPQLARLHGVARSAERIPELIDQIHEQLLRVRRSGRHPVLLVDEAQLLAEPSTLEEFRALLNLAQDGERLLTLVLFGMEELGGTLSLDPSLLQRVDVRLQLSPFSAAESGAYLAHRLDRAGGSAALLAPETVDALYRYSGGVLRVLNTLADNALFEAALDESRQVGAEHVAAAAAQLDLRPANSAGEPGAAASSFRSAVPEPFIEPAAPSPSPAPLVPPVEVEQAANAREEGPETGEGADDWLEPMGPVMEEVLRSFEDATPTRSLDRLRSAPAASESPAQVERNEATAVEDDPLGWALVEPKDDPLASSAPDAPRTEELASLPGAVSDDDSMDNLSFADELELTPEDALPDEPQEAEEEMEELMLEDEQPELPIPAPRPRAKGPNIDLPEDDDLDLLFDDIQVDS